jgi:hypothetical protein
MKIRAQSWTHYKPYIFLISGKKKYENVNLQFNDSELRILTSFIVALRSPSNIKLKAQR